MRALALALTLAAPLSASAQPFLPFTVVPDVCPECTDPHHDVLELTDGTRVAAIILVELPEHFILTRNGELRAAPRALVAKVTRSAAQRPPASGHVDQILLTSGLVLSGRITAEHASGYYELRGADGRLRYVAHRGMIAKIYRSGRAQAP